MGRYKSSFKSKMVLLLLAMLAAVVLVTDIREIVLGKVDLNKWIPFLYPALLGFFMYIVWRTDRILSGE